jgi:polar amino acid transport system substrate-binding protein
MRVGPPVGSPTAIRLCRRVAGVAALIVAGVAGPAAVAHYVELGNETATHDVLTMGVAMDGRPFAYRRDGAAVGFQVALARAIAESAGIGFRTVVLPRDGRVDALRQGGIDLVNSSLPGDVLPDGVALVPTLVVGDHMMVLRGNPYGMRAVDDLAGQIAAVTEGSSAEAFVRSIDAGFRAAGRRPMHIHSFPSLRWTTFPVTMGHAQAYFVETRSAVTASQDPESRVRLVEGAFRPSGEIGFLVESERAELVDALRHGVARMVATGRYAKLLADYGLPPELSAYPQH